MTSPAAERQRIDAAPIMRSEIWHADGSIVLQTENMQFRVHWSVLAMHSSFFRDMQGLPQPSDRTEPTIDGCPVIELQDAAIDVEHLLKAVYEPTFLAQDAIPFAAIAALVRLGRKYDFRNLLDFAVSRVTFENPTTLEGYDARLHNDKYIPTRIVPYPGVLYDVLTLARENDILSALPCAYYRAIRFHSTKQLLDGIPRGDGSVAVLAPMDQRRCVLARENLVNVQVQMGYSLGILRSRTTELVNCSDSPKCSDSLHQRLGHYLDHGGLRALAKYQPVGETGLCTSCTRYTANLNDAGRKRMWEELPEYFELPPWSELEDDL
ncbi:hypothetical protein C8F04DRAFT_1086976 [Mycena alexandri]|uniref:BTB domain-containing protein n=1 Tax=Mycena alexandri TaxID=1745969 RepID=A0AAD6T4C6_9AGAR|nr:hypothetical protein C8F04DRAFT_1086976 [Mycena alexandri]